MRGVLAFLLLFLAGVAGVAGVTANAATVTLSWDHYTDSALPTGSAYDAVNYKITGVCMVNATVTTYTNTTGAANDTMPVLIPVTLQPNDAIKCRIEALRVSDGQVSPWGAEVALTVPLAVPATPMGLKLQF